ncbi:MAG TPA: ATP-binding protein [Solirubrobacteraceae bacterium]|jgi:anti-sigma regulatory factor (Ser/Thr protein kinase)|nr:ATP-binding protein [Solirubrobacteraceae bacterium]
MRERSAAATACDSWAPAPHGARLRLDLARDREAPARARAAIDRWCPELDGGRSRQETLLLLVSEIVTNAVMHSRAPEDAAIVLSAGMHGEHVRVEVTDGGDGFTPPSDGISRRRERMTIGGYGLYVVDQAATRWGVDRAGGTRVWFDI